jgi:ribonucleotide monophosphatase NagD (HAD superfamily)
MLPICHNRTWAKPSKLSERLRHLIIGQLWAQVTGKTLYHEFFGKPGPAPYELAEDLLYDQAVELGLVDHQQHLGDLHASTGPNAIQTHPQFRGNVEGASPAAELRSYNIDRGLPGDGASAEAFGAIYAVGDNPKADIAGALGAQRRGRPYVSMLVRTGVFQSRKMNDEEFPADVVVDDVDAAVQSALHRTRSMRWHSMR